MSFARAEARKKYNQGKLRENHLPADPLCKQEELPPLDLGQLNRAGRRLLGRWYVGTFEEDTIPRPPIVPIGANGWCMIVNTLKRDAPMSKSGHWIALCETPDGQTHFFDSYGRQPTVSKWYDYLVHYSKHHRPPSFNSTPVQAFSTNSCGYFCLEYLKARKAHPSLSDSQVVRNFLPPEHILCKNRKKILSSRYPIIKH